MPQIVDTIFFQLMQDVTLDYRNNRLNSTAVHQSFGKFAEKFEMNQLCIYCLITKINHGYAKKLVDTGRFEFNTEA